MGETLDTGLFIELRPQPLSMEGEGGGGDSTDEHPNTHSINLLSTENVYFIYLYQSQSLQITATWIHYQETMFIVASLYFNAKSFNFALVGD